MYEMLWEKVREAEVAWQSEYLRESLAAHDAGNRRQAMELLARDLRVLGRMSPDLMGMFMAVPMSEINK